MYYNIIMTIKMNKDYIGFIYNLLLNMKSKTREECKLNIYFL